MLHLQPLHIIRTQGSISQGNLILYFSIGESKHMDFGISKSGVIHRSIEYMARFKPSERAYWEAIAKSYYPIVKK